MTVQGLCSAVLMVGAKMQLRDLHSHVECGSCSTYVPMTKYYHCPFLGRTCTFYSFNDISNIFLCPKPFCLLFCMGGELGRSH